jgi:pimeloyl-ACP methyl ester carboxylesterase
MKAHSHILFVYGISGSAAQFDDARRRLLAKTGLESSVVSHSGHDGKPAPKGGVKRLDYDRLGHEVVAEAEKLGEYVGEIHLVGHSQGAAAAHIAARHSPALFKTVTLLAPALTGGITAAAHKALTSWGYLLPLLMIGDLKIRPDHIKELFFNGGFENGREERIAAAMAKQPAATRALKEGLERRLEAPAVETLVAIAKDDRVLSTDDQRAWATRYDLDTRSRHGHHMSLLEGEWLADLVAEVTKRSH